jgi:hypothetical protein
MTDHPITPPPELRQLWAQQAQRIDPLDPVQWMQYVSEKAAQWGADQELEACCAWLKEWQEDKHAGGIENLRAARRPKQPSLKEQALDALQNMDHMNQFPNEDDFKTIRRALEALDD